MVNQKGTEYRKKEDLKRFFYPQEWLDFYNVLDVKVKFYYNFLMQTGARYTELKHVEYKDIDWHRNIILIRFAKTRSGGLKRIKITCEKCNNKINLSKILKFCHLCGHEIKDTERLLELYNQKIVKRRREIRKIKVSKVFIEELKIKSKELNMNKDSTFNMPTIQHLNQTMKRILKKLKVSDWKDFSPHNVRKTHENYLLATGSNPLSMRMHMGHSIDVATAHYISANVFTPEEIGMIKMILNNLKV
jgi:integrase